ncbi:hypothetical protein GCM10010384_39910 [Streptomyces djakartensis]|uniref:Uncharacterized protein n=2 Tax=Streptomyces djakartensis TaxID=68193 RepID=A0ABQ2ZXE6_9ACTN|nr:hypothetical protein GCM10010384_39910 [Streptomyces djakartensis]
MAAHGRRRDCGVMKSAGGTVRRLLAISGGETILVIVIGAALGVLVTLPPLAGMACGLSQATSSDVGLHLSTRYRPGRRRRHRQGPAGAGGVRDTAMAYR